ncbi:MAG TPA: hypothetical protein PKI59_05400, partial [Candidatus Cloacimonadota bacterium]|nr:hypothetical protein [Candidatus Cloacimonadota bacterium]
MKNKKLLLVTVLVVLILIFFILRLSRNEEKLESIFPLSADKIGSIEIWNNEHSIALAKLE